MPSLLESNSTDTYFAQQTPPDPKSLSVLQLVVWPFYNRDERRLRAFWRLSLHLVVAIILMLIPFLALGAIATALGAVEVLENDTLGGIIQSVAFALAALVCFVLLDRRPAWGRLGREWIGNLIFGLALGAIAMMIIMGVEYSLGWVQIVRVGASDDMPWNKLLGLLAIYLVLFTAVAVGEESFSRAYQLKNISEGFSFLGPVYAALFSILVTSSIFALLHWFNPNSNWISTLGIMAAGIMLAAARVFTGSLAAPIGIHLTWNFFQGPVFGFPVSGNSFFDSLIVLNQGGPEVWTGGAFGPEAGLIGTVVIVLMLVALWFWARFNHRSIPLEIIKLAHYKPRTRRKRKQLPPEAIPVGVSSASAQTVYEEKDTILIEDSKL